VYMTALFSPRLCIQCVSGACRDFGDGSNFQLVTRKQKEQFDPTVC